MSGDIGQPFAPPGAAPFDAPGLRGEPAAPAAGKGKIVAALMVGVIILVVLAVLALMGGDDSKGDSSSGRFPAGVRSDPSDKQTTIELDDGAFMPGAVVGDVLIVTEPGDHAAIIEVRGIDLKSGDERWTHDAQSAILVGSEVFVVDDGTLTRLDSDGEDSEEDLSVDDSTVLGATRGWVLTYEDDAISIVDPSSLEVLIRDVEPGSCSENGKYCTRIDYDSDANESELTVIDVSSGDEVGDPITAEGFAVAYVQDDRRVVLTDGGDLVLYSSTGKELSREEIPDDASIELRSGEHLIVKPPGGEHEAWTINEKLATADVEGADGRIVATSDPDIVIIDTIDDEVQVCRLTDDGFDCDSVVDGNLADLADDVFYVTDNDTVVAYDLRDTDDELWSIDIDEGKSVVALDGKVAIYGADEDGQTSTIDVYG